MTCLPDPAGFAAAKAAMKAAAACPAIVTDRDPNELEAGLRLLALRLRLQQEADGHACEPNLLARCWWPYRLVPSAFGRTLAFARAFDQALVEALPADPRLSAWQREKRRARGVLPPHVFARVDGEGRVAVHPSWPRLVAGRRRADQHTVDYLDYCRFALRAAEMRGWDPAHARNATVLCAERLWLPGDGRKEASVVALLVREYRERPRLAAGPYFAAAGWAGEPLQRAYVAWAGREVLRAKGGAWAAAKRAWDGYVRDGALPPLPFPVDRT